MTKDAPDSYEFNAKITWTGGKEGSITIKDKPQLPLTSPIQWDGKPNAYSPHDLFMSAVAGCFITTFAVMMKRMKQPITAHQVDGRGVVQKHPEGGWYFTVIFITMNVTIPNDAQLSKVQRAVTLTEKYCQISRSIACKIHVEPKITKLD